MTLARTPDTGSFPRDRQGPRTALSLAQITALRAEAAAGANREDLARRYRITSRSVYRYLRRGPDPVATTVAEVLDLAALEYGVSLSRLQRREIAAEVAHRLRQAGWLG